MVSTTNSFVGATLYQTDILGNIIGQSVITAINSLTQITVTDVFSWIIGSATVYYPISVAMTYAPISGNVAWVSHFMDCEMFFRQDTSFNNLQVLFSSDFDRSTETTIIKAVIGGGWGTVPWGGEPWGGVTSIAPVIRTMVPRNKARAHWLNASLNHNEALANFAVTGINFFFNYVSSRFK